MKRAILALLGMAVLFTVRARRRVGSLRSELGKRLDEVDARRLRHRVDRLGKRAGKIDTERIKGQVAALLALADSIDDKRLRKEARRLQKGISDLDTGAVRVQATKLSEALAQVRDRAQPRRRRFRVFPLFVLAGLAAGGYAAFRNRQRLGSLQEIAQGRLPGGSSGVDEQQLKASVESVIHQAAPTIAADLQVQVEGRTVYLRGSATDREKLEPAVRQAQEVPGVAAVINLVSMGAPGTSGSATTAATSATTATSTDGSGS